MFRASLKIHCVLAITLFFCCQLACAESTMNKCTDGTEITYTDKPCEKLGLKNAGPIKYTVTITPASPISDVPQNKVHEMDGAVNNAPVPSVVDSDIYQCTAYFGVVSFSSEPCPKFSFIPQLGYNKPVQQQKVSLKSACEKISANPGSRILGGISCP